MSYKRAKALEDTAAEQAEATKEQAKANHNTEQGQRQQRLRNAIQHLGHKSASVRLGGAYELFHLVEEEDMKKLRQTVLDILCAHIRQTTGTAKYREVHNSRPSEEIRSLLFLLFGRPHVVFKGCSIDLQGSYLNGADLSRARLSGANLTRAKLLNAELTGANLARANLTFTELTGPDPHENRTLPAQGLTQKQLNQACADRPPHSRWPP